MAAVGDREADVAAGEHVDDVLSAVGGVVAEAGASLQAAIRVRGTAPVKCQAEAVASVRQQVPGARMAL